MKTIDSNQVQTKRNVFRSLPNFWVSTATAFIALTTLAQAQFYVAQGESGKIGRVTAAGVPSPAYPTPFVSFPAGDVQGITSDSSGNVFAAVGTSIYQITPGGTSSLYGTYTNTIRGLTMSSSGVLYGVSVIGGGNDVGIYANAGGGTFASLSLSNPNPYSFYSANGLGFDSSGNLFVTNISYGGPDPFSVVKLTPSGPDWTSSSFVSYGIGNYQPYDVATDSANNVYVSSALNTATILKYNSAGVLDGTFNITGITATDAMRGLTFANNKLYAVDASDYKMYEIDPTTGAATNFIGSGNLPDYRSTFLTYTAVPEPSIMALVAFAGLALAGCRGSRKNSRVSC